MMVAALHGKSQVRLASTLALLLCWSGALRAADFTDAQSWLDAMVESARRLSYVGTFVHQTGNRIETTRVVHASDDTGATTKLESLDGPAREIIRQNDEVYCYMPDKKMVRLDRSRARKFFPALIVEPSSALLNHYSVGVAGQERVAGYDCRMVLLQPKDKMRFGHRLCAELKTGLLLKAVMLNDQNEPVEQIAFTEVSIGKTMPRGAIRSVYADDAASWQTDATAYDANTEGPWYVREMPPGFRKIMQMQRRMLGKAEPVIHMMFSDGLAAFSVFIEPKRARPVAAGVPAQRGSVAVYRRQLAEHQVTVLGEVPPGLVQQIGNAVAARR